MNLPVLWDVTLFGLLYKLLFHYLQTVCRNCDLVVHFVRSEASQS